VLGPGLGRPQGERDPDPRAWGDGLDGDDGFTGAAGELKLPAQQRVGGELVAG